MLAAAEIPFECVALRDGDELRALRATNKLMFSQLAVPRWRNRHNPCPCNTSHVPRALYGDTIADAARCDMCTASAKTSRGRL